VTRIELWYLKEAQIAAASSSTFVVSYVGGASPRRRCTPQRPTRTSTDDADLRDQRQLDVDDDTQPAARASCGHGRRHGGRAAITGDLGSFTWNNGWTEGTDQSFSSANTTSGDHAATANGTDTASATHTGPEPASDRRRRLGRRALAPSRFEASRQRRPVIFDKMRPWIEPRRAVSAWPSLSRCRLSSSWPHALRA
jgi:hypothetical protein